MVESGRLDEVKLVVRKAVNAARTKLAKRTGYKLVGAAVHPDSRGVIGYHLQFQTAAGGQLLGRSAKGKKGGLRLAGDAMSAVARYSEFVEVTDRFGVLGRDCDDIALNKAVDWQCEKLLGPEEWAKVEARARAMADDWQRRRDEALARRADVADLKRQLEDMRRDYYVTLLEQQGRIDKQTARAKELEEELKVKSARVVSLEAALKTEETSVTAFAVTVVEQEEELKIERARVVSLGARVKEQEEETADITDRFEKFIDACDAVLPPALFAAVGASYDAARRGPTKPPRGPAEAVPAL
jgi:hypothetical protein